MKPLEQSSPSKISRTERTGTTGGGPPAVSPSKAHRESTRAVNRINRLKKWALKRFKGRGKFMYPSFCAHLCCCKTRDTKKRMKFAENKLRKERDIARFIN